MIRVKLLITAGLLILAFSILLSDRAIPNSENLYDLKRLQEKIFMAVKTNPRDKKDYYDILLDKRLKELVAIVENGQYDYVLTSSLRYSTTAGRLTELIIDHQIKDSISATQNKFREHQETIKKLASSYPSDENERGKFIQDDFNYLEIYLSQLADAAAK